MKYHGLNFPTNPIKLNNDVAYFEDGMGATGAVLHNDHAEAVVGVIAQLFQTASAASAEAFAMENGLALLEQLGCSPVIIESDSLDIIQLCNGDMEVLTHVL